MAETVADVVIGVSADVSPLMRETARAGAAVNKFGADMSRSVGTGARGVTASLEEASAAAATFGADFVRGLAAGVVSTGLVGMANGVRTLIGAIADMADEAERVGVSAENFQELQYGMKLAGVQADEFASGLSKFADNIGDAARGTGKLKDVLEENGIALRDVEGDVRSTTELLSDFADMIQRVPDEATRMSLITEAFGKGGKAMTLALSGGSAGLAEMQQAAQDAGVVLDDSVVARAAELDDKFDALTARVTTFFQTVSVGAAGAADDLAGMLAAGLTSDAATPVVNLDASYDTSAAADAADRLSDALGIQAAVLLEADATHDAALAVMDLSSQIDDLTIKLQSGTIGFDEYQAGLAGIASEADGMFQAIEDANGLDLSDVRAQITAFTDLMGGMFGTVFRLGPSMSGLTAETYLMADAFEATAKELDAVGNTGAAEAMRDVAKQIADLASDFRDGEIDGETFRIKLGDLVKGAGFAVSALGDIDGVTFGNVNGAISGVIGYLGRMVTAARLARESLPGASPATIAGHGGRAEPAEYVSNLAPKESPRPGRRDVDFEYGAGDAGDGKGGGGGPSDAELEALINSLETERETLEEWYAESAAMLAGATDAQLEQLGGRHEAIERLEREHQEKLLAIRSSGDGDALSNAASFFGSLATITQNGGDKANKAYRAFAAAEALINTYRAAAQTLADPRLGFFTKFAAVASVIGAGMGLANALKGGGSSSGGGSVRAPSSVSSSGAASGGPMSVANITLVGDTFSKSSVEDLFKQINDGLKTGRTINLVTV